MKNLKGEGEDTLTEKENEIKRAEDNTKNPPQGAPGDNRQVGPTTDAGRSGAIESDGQKNAGNRTDYVGRQADAQAKLNDAQAAKPREVQVKLNKAYVPLGSKQNTSGGYDKEPAGSIISVPGPEAADICEAGIATPTRNAFM